MKLITGVLDTIKTFQGKEVHTILEEGGVPIPITTNEALVNSCPSSSAQDLGSAKDLLLAHSLGQKIWAGNDEILLEEQEITLLKKIIEKSQGTALLLGTLLKVLEKAEEVAVMPEVSKPDSDTPKTEVPKK